MVKSSDFMRAITMEDNLVVLIFSGDPRPRVTIDGVLRCNSKVNGKPRVGWNMLAVDVSWISPLVKRISEII